MSLITAQLIASLAEKLIQKAPTEAGDASKDELAGFLEKLMKGGKLDLGAIAKEGDITDSIMDSVLGSLKKLKAKSGTKRSGLFGRGIFASILGGLDSPFGHHDRPKSDLPNSAGDPSSPAAGIHALRYFVERLPVVEGQNTLQLLRIAWESWSDVCDIDIKQTGDRSNANVIVNVKPLNEPASVLAIADVGPPDGKQLELTFDERKEGTWTRHKFLATAAHEMGHILGLDHILNVDDQLMNELLHDDIEGPKTADIAAVVKIWGAA